VSRSFTPLTRGMTMPTFEKARSPEEGAYREATRPVFRRGKRLDEVTVRRVRDIMIVALHGLGCDSEDVGSVFGITGRQVRNRVDQVREVCGMEPGFSEAFDRIRAAAVDAEVRQEAYQQAL
jgi:hypothetical protein